MKVVSLGEVVECLDRFRVPVKESERAPGDVPYYGANGQQGWIDRAIFNEPLVVVAEDGGHFESPQRGVAYRIAGPTWVNNHGHVLRATATVDTDYLFQVLRNYDFTPYISGSTRSKLTQQQISKAEIPLPPLPEQRRIAAILDQADELRAKRRLTLGLHDDLTQSIFLDMFGRQELPGAIAGEFMVGVRNGVSPSTRGTVPGTVLTLSSVTRGTFNASANKPATFDDEPGADKRVAAGDFLMCRGNGNLRLVGVGVAVHESHSGLVFPDTVIATAIDDSKVRLTYLEAAWSQPQTRQQIASIARTTNGTYKVNQKTLAGVRIPLPGLSEQDEFVSRVESVRAVRRTADADQLDELFASLQSRAFAGQL